MPLLQSFLSLFLMSSPSLSFFSTAGPISPADRTAELRWSAPDIARSTSVPGLAGVGIRDEEVRSSLVHWLRRLKARPSDGVSAVARPPDVVAPSENVLVIVRFFNVVAFFEDVFSVARPPGIIAPFG